MKLWKQVQRLKNVRAFKRFWQRNAAPMAIEQSIAKHNADPKKIAWDQIMTLLGPKTDGPFGNEARRELTLPRIMPGVIPAALPKGDRLVLAMDGGHAETERLAFDNMPPAAWGGGAGVLGPGLSFLGFPYLAELVQISEYRIPSEALSTEMTQRWMKLKNKGKKDLKDKLAEITERMEHFKIRELFREAALKTEQFGRAHIMINVKGQEDDLPRQNPLTTIEKGALLGFACIEAYWLTPYSWNATQPEKPDFYRPQSWFVLGKKTHNTRLLTFIFREVPDLLKPAYDFAGISMSQLMMPYVNRWLRTAKNVNDLINIFSIVTLSTDLQSLLQDPVEFVKRLTAFTQGRDNRGVMVINKTTEELNVNDVSLGSLDKLQAQAQEHMATPARMPLITFFGITPTGLSASSDGEFKARRTYVKGMQEMGFTPHLEVVINLVQMDLYGEINSDITHEWVSLDNPEGKDLADLRKADGERDLAYVEKSVISADEVRDKLRNDPESGYANLVGPAPEPPDLMADPEEGPKVEADE